MPTLQELDDQKKALQVAQRFIKSHAEFVPCPENRDVLFDWFVKHKAHASDENFEQAYHELVSQNRLVLTEYTPTQLALLSPAAQKHHMILTGQWPTEQSASTKAERIRDYRAEKKAKEVARMPPN